MTFDDTSSRTCFPPDILHHMNQSHRYESSYSSSVYITSHLLIMKIYKKYLHTDSTWSHYYIGPLYATAIKNIWWRLWIINCTNFLTFRGLSSVVLFPKRYGFTRGYLSCMPRSSIIFVYYISSYSYPLLFVHRYDQLGFWMQIWYAW